MFPLMAFPGQNTCSHQVCFRGHLGLFDVPRLDPKRYTKHDSKKLSKVSTKWGKGGACIRMDQMGTY